MDAEEAVRTLAIIGVGVFAIVVILALTYQGYATTANQLQQQSITCSGAANTITCSTNPSNGFFANAVNLGYYGNYTKYGGPLPNTFGSNLGLAITALVLFVVIAIVAGLFLNRGKGGVLGG